MEFKKEKLNLIQQNKKLRVIFSYDYINKENTLKNLKMFVAYRRNVENYSILFFDIENSKDLNEDEKLYLYFTHNPGVHFLRHNFENIVAFKSDYFDINDINQFANENYLKNRIMNEWENNSFNTDSNSNKISSFDNVFKNNEKKLVTAKIVEKLDKFNFDDKRDIKQDDKRDIKQDDNNQIIGLQKANINNQKNIISHNFVKTQNLNKEDFNKNYSISNFQTKNNTNSNNIKITEDNKEDIVKHDAGMNKIKILLIYFIIYCVIYSIFYLKVSKREDAKNN
jgi:hypothetical protein